MPALAARAPAGATQPITGTFDDRIAWLMSRVAASSPPGVSMPQHHRRRPLVCGSPDAALHIVAGRRADAALDVEHIHRAGLRFRRCPRLHAGRT